jgi:hypothetical protein
VGCSSTTSPTFDLIQVNAAGVGVTTGLNFVVGTSWPTTNPGGATAFDFAGPFTYSLGAAPPPAPPPPPPPPLPPSPPPPPAKTYKSAPGLPSAIRYTGRSIKHVRVTATTLATMKLVGGHKVLAVACWSADDWPAVLDSIGEETQPGLVLRGFWLRAQPRWIHLSPSVCTNLQALFDSRIPNSPRAGAATTVIHETVHAYGISNEAQANCYAVQLVPEFARQLRLLPARAAYLAQLAYRRTRALAPRGYWDSARCRDGGQWDLAPSLRNL